MSEEVEPEIHVGDREGYYLSICHAVTVFCFVINMDVFHVRYEIMVIWED